MQLGLFGSSSVPQPYTWAAKVRAGLGMLCRGSVSRLQDPTKVDRLSSGICFCAQETCPGHIAFFRMWVLLLIPVFLAERQKLGATCSFSQFVMTEGVQSCCQRHVPDGIWGKEQLLFAGRGAEAEGMGAQVCGHCQNGCPFLCCAGCAG